MEAKKEGDYRREHTMVTTEKITPEEQKKDEEDRKAFLELQGKFYEEQTKLKSLLGSVAGSAREKRKNELCLQEISVLPTDTNCYRTVGRTFVLVDKDDMCRELEQSIKDNEEYQKTSKDKQLYLEKQVKDREAELRELLEQAPRLAQAIAGGQR